MTTEDNDEIVKVPDVERILEPNDYFPDAHNVMLISKSCFANYAVLEKSILTYNEALNATRDVQLELV